MKEERINLPKVISDGKIRISMYVMSVCFFFSIFFMPDYFGIKLGVAFNMQRIFLIIIWCWIFKVEFRKRSMIRIIVENKTNIFIVLYLFVCLYTMVLRVDVGTLMNPLIDYIAVFYTTIYFMETYWDVKKFIAFITKIGYALCSLGILEAIVKKPFFGALETIPGMFVGRVIRDGSYRIMGPAHHPLGYGLFLLILFPLICYDEEKNKVYLLKNLPLVLMILLNVLLTGSRSTLGIMAIEILLLMFFSKKEERKQYWVIGSWVIILVTLLIILFLDTSLVQSILGRLATTIDGALGTSFASYLDLHSASLKDSSQYRTYLPMIFKLDWLNPILGRGNGYSFGWHVGNYWIVSIDNFYVGQYIKIAYPGLITIVLLFLANIKYAVIGMFQTKDVFYKILFTVFLAYFLNLWWVDSLGTLDYIFVLFGILYVRYKHMKHEKGEKMI